MKPDDAAIEARWELVRQLVLDRPDLTKGDPTIGELARVSGLPWFRLLDQQRLSEYLARDYRALMWVHGFGMTKRDQLIAILEATVLSPMRAGAAQLDACGRLAEWGVSESIPVTSLPLPMRVLGFCEREGLTSIGQLVRAVETQGVMELQRRRNLGHKSVGELLEMVGALQSGDRQKAARWLPVQGAGEGTVAGAAPVYLDACSRLAEWGVPESFPVAVLPLPARVLGLCEEDGLKGLGQLLRLAESLGERGLLLRRNLGRKSIRELLDLVEALRLGDRPQAGRWLPLAEDGPGLSLGVAVKRLIADLDARQRPMLKRRLVDEMTLEEAAKVFRVTRERVRQVVRDVLLDPIQRLFEVFPAEQAELFQGWLAGKSPAEHLGAFVSAEDAVLADGAFRELFSDDPEAVAAALDQELQCERCYEKLYRSIEFHLQGVDLQSFLEQELPVRMHAVFTEYLFQRNGLSVDHETGRIGPEKPSLRRLVAALLAEEDEAIPATWLLRLVQEAKAFQSLTLDELRARYRGWAQRYPEFAKQRVIWGE